MWEKYGKIELRVNSRFGTMILDLPTGRDRPIQEIIHFELVAEGTIRLDELAIQIEVGENKLTRRS